MNNYIVEFCMPGETEVHKEIVHAPDKYKVFQAIGKKYDRGRQHASQKCVFKTITQI